MKINIKKIFSIRTNFFIKNSKQFIFQKKSNIRMNESKNNIFFLDVPEYGNLGDQAIALAMEKIMKDIYPQRNCYEFRQGEVIQYLKWLKQNIKPNDIICLTGGGNMGTSYQRYEELRRIIIKTFKHNRIIIFPQTIDYNASKYDKREEQIAAKIYNNHGKILLMARENNSFKKMKRIFNNCKVLLCPDIVLYLDYSNFNNHDTNRQKILGLCLRKDKEKIIKDDDLKKIYDIKMNKQEISTTCNLKAIINNVERKKIVEDKLKEIANCDLFITDRLHGMIFAYITDTPCIALPNSNGKIEGVYKWISNKGKVIFEKEFKEIGTIKKQKNQKLTKEFEQLKQEIIEF